MAHAPTRGAVAVVLQRRRHSPWQQEIGRVYLTAEDAGQMRAAPPRQRQLGEVIREARKGAAPDRLGLRCHLQRIDRLEHAKYLGERLAKPGYNAQLRCENVSIGEARRRGRATELVESTPGIRCGQPNQ